MPLQMSARAVDAAEFSRCCAACDIHEDSVHSLVWCVEKVVRDGREALSNRTDVSSDAVADLERCNSCSAVRPERASDCLCVDGDVWAAAIDERLFECRKPSVDFILFVKDEVNVVKACLAEAKLGNTLPKSGRARHPTRMELYEKIDYSRRRVCSRMPVCGDAFLIASRSTVDEQASRVHRWNLEQAFPVRVRCACLHDFLEAVDIPLQQSKKC